MRSNLEKWNEYKAELEKRDQAFIAKELSEVPKVIFCVDARGRIVERIVQKVGYRHLHATWFSGKKPTNKDVEKIRAYLGDLALEREEIIFYWKEESGSQGATWISQLNEYPYLTTSKSEALAMAKVNKEKSDREDALLKSGDHFRCEYCGKVTPESEAVPRTIINFKMYGRQGKRRKYCSGECGYHDQCAHEG